MTKEKTRKYCRSNWSGFLMVNDNLVNLDLASKPRVAIVVGDDCGWLILYWPDLGYVTRWCAGRNYKYHYLKNNWKVYPPGGSL